MKIRILQWNIWYKEPIENIAIALKEFRADIVCLQELTIGMQREHSNTVAYIAEQLGKYDFHCAAVDFPDYQQVNGIFSKYPITERSQCWINTPEGRGGYDDEYRSYVEAAIDIGGEPLLVGTTHMSYTDRFAETPRKNKEADTLQSVIGDKKRYVLAGDFNALPGSYTLRKLQENLVQAGPKYEEYTWTTKPFNYNGFEARTLDWRIDYVMTSPDIRVLSSNVKIVSSSDHLPILTVIDV